MKKIFIFCMLSFAVSQYVNAQQTALTSKGEVVILYDNGTWKYASVSDNETDTSTSEVVEASNGNEAIVLKDGEISSTTFIESISAKLKKYFKNKNIVRCKFKLISKDGKVSLISEWKVMTGEGYSYFGYIKKGNKLSLKLINGKTVDLIFAQDCEPVEYEKYGFSTYSASIDLDEEQIRILKDQIVMKSYMNWSKRTEEYAVVNPSYFIKAIPQITK